MEGIDAQETLQQKAEDPNLLNIASVLNTYPYISK